MKTRLYQHLLEKRTKGQKSFAVLIDPDKVDEEKIDQLTPFSNSRLPHASNMSFCNSILLKKFLQT